MHHEKLILRGEKKNPAHRVQTTCLALAYTNLHVLRQMSPEPDLIDSILLFILIKEERSCSSVSLSPSTPALRRCFV